MTDTMCMLLIQRDQSATQILHQRDYYPYADCQNLNQNKIYHTVQKSYRQVFVACQRKQNYKLQLSKIVSQS